MPFEDDEIEESKLKNNGLKQVSSKKSIFDASKQEKPSFENFEKKVDQIHKKMNDYKSRASELAISYKKLIMDKTLPQNKNIFIEDSEKEILSKMVNLAVEINNDEDEQEGMGTLGWITLLLKYFLYHRDRLNSLEYAVSQLQKSNEELKKKITSLSTPIDQGSKSE